MTSFENKKILITGATGGIGGELVKKFTSLIKLKANDHVLDIASNDATLLNFYQKIF